MSNNTRTCEVEGCDRKHYGRGWCNLHYQRWRKRGCTSVTNSGREQDPEVRLAESAIWMEDGCYVWVGSYSGRGRSMYGKLTRGGRQVYAHRYAYEAAYGPIPEGMSVNHICGNTLCVYWGHLEATTHQENVQYRAKGGSSGRKYGSRRGAHFHKPTGTWMARYSLNGEQVVLGYFSTEEEAAAAASAGRSAARFHREPIQS